MSADAPHPYADSDEDTVSWLIFELARAHRGLAAILLRRLDLHPGQELILMRLHQRDGQSQSDLVASVGVDHSTMSKSLKRMQDTGLLIRKPSERDGRVMVAHLTEKGKGMRAPLAAMWRELDEATTCDLDPDQASMLRSTAPVIIDSIRHRTSRL